MRYIRGYTLPVCDIHCLCPVVPADDLGVSVPVATRHVRQLSRHVRRPVSVSEVTLEVTMATGTKHFAIRSVHL